MTRITESDLIKLNADLMAMGINSGGIYPTDTIAERIEISTEAVMELIRRVQPQTTFPAPQTPGIGTTLIDSIGQEWTVTHYHNASEVGVSRMDGATPWHFHAVSDNGGTIWYIGEPDNMVRPRNDAEWAGIAERNDYYHRADHGEIPLTGDADRPHGPGDVSGRIGR